MRPWSVNTDQSISCSSREMVWAGLLLAGFLVVFFYDIAFLNKTLRLSNTTATSYPWGHYNYPVGSAKYISVYDNVPAILEEPYQEFKERSLRRKTFPLWNPHQAGGYPFLATQESSQLFLPEIVLYVLPSPYRWDVYLLFRLLIAGVFTYTFARVIGLPPLSAAVAGMAYMYSGPILSWVTNVTLNADILLPLVLLLTELILRRDQKRLVVYNAIVIFQTVAGGHPEHTFFTFLTVSIYVIFRLGGKAYGYSFQRVITHLAISFGLGMGLSAVLLLPFSEYLFFNSWHYHGPGVGSWAVWLREGITMVFPWYFSDGIVSNKGLTHNTWPGGWIGLLPIWLTIFATFARGKVTYSFVFIFIFIAYLSKVYGFWFINWIGHLPVFSLQRWYLHITQAAAFSIAILCGFAISYLRSDERNIVRFALALIPIVAISFAYLELYPPSNDPSRIFTVPVVIGLSALTGVLLAVSGVIGRKAFAWGIAILLLVELFLLIPRHRIERATAFQVPPYIEFLRRQRGPFRVYGIDGCLYPNTATGLGVDDIGIYEGLFVKRFATYIRDLVDDSHLQNHAPNTFRAYVKDPKSRFLDLLNLKYFILPKQGKISPRRMKELSLRIIYDREVRIAERLNVMPRAMIRRHADFISNDERVLSVLKNGYDIRRRVILDREPKEGKVDPALPAEDGSTVDVIEYKPNSKSFQVDMKNNGYLIANDVHYPGWKVEVDGKTQEILTANYLFQAVFVPKGQHQVVFEFMPLSFQAGLAVSFISLALLSLWAVKRPRPRE